MGTKTLDIVLSLLAAAAFLAIAVLAWWRGRTANVKPVAWPFALLCLDLFAYNLLQAISDSTSQPTWRWLNAAMASLATAFFYHLVIAFVGRRGALKVPLLAAYTYFSALAGAGLAPFFIEGNTFPGGNTWALLILAAELPVLGHTTLLLWRNLAGASSAERSRTRLVMAAGLIAGTAASIELLAVAGSTWSPPIAIWGLLLSALVLGAAALRVLEGITFLTRVNAAAIGLTVVLAEVAVFTAFGDRLALVVAGSLLVVLAALASMRFVVADYTSDRERTLAHASLGRLAAQMAHDIKNPLASIRGAAQFLTGERAAGRSVDGQGEFLTLLVEQCDRMAQVIDHYQRIGRAEAVLKPVPLNAAVGEALKFLGPHPKDVHLEDDLPACEADRDLLVIALENVLKNAREAAPDKPVHVQTGRAETSVWVAVRDEGPGMDVRTKERALEGFFTTKAQGSGLGLAYVRRVVESHRGRLTLDTREGAGTTVKIELRAAP
ncbi:MAG: ATP-binding protein [Myxococcaceae bacterium]|nr:ATP-binding protein [Myxococcaceae bacterium]